MARLMLYYCCLFRLIICFQIQNAQLPDAHILWALRQSAGWTRTTGAQVWKWVSPFTSGDNLIQRHHHVSCTFYEAMLNSRALHKLAGFVACGTNCHKKCEKLMGNLCGVNQKLFSDALSAIQKGKKYSMPVSTEWHPWCVRCSDSCLYLQLK